MIPAVSSRVNSPGIAPLVPPIELPRLHVPLQLGELPALPMLAEPVRPLSWQVLARLEQLVERIGLHPRLVERVTLLESNTRELFTPKIALGEHRGLLSVEQLRYLDLEAAAVPRVSDQFAAQLTRFVDSVSPRHAVEELFFRAAPNNAAPLTQDATRVALPGHSVAANSWRPDSKQSTRHSYMRPRPQPYQEKPTKQAAKSFSFAPLIRKLYQFSADIIRSVLG